MASELPKILHTRKRSWLLARGWHPSSGSLLSRADIVIYPEEICRIVFLLDGGQSGQIRAERCLDDVVCFNIERRKQMCVLRERPQDFLAGSGPLAVCGRLLRIRPLSNKQDVPR